MKINSIGRFQKSSQLLKVEASDRFLSFPSPVQKPEEFFDGLLTTTLMTLGNQIVIFQKYSHRALIELLQFVHSSPGVHTIEMAVQAQTNRHKSTDL